jgi:pimeloyl-ACP methyl ester carboxylesterase
MDVTELDLRGSNGIRLRADEVGDRAAPPVVLFHGGGQTRFAWGSTATVLADRGWHAYRVDMRGHSESDWPDDGDYRLEAFAEDVRAIARTVTTGSHAPVLVGASLGGLASLMAIGESPEPTTVARALVLVDVAPTIEPAGTARIGDFMTANMETGFGSLDEVADAVAAYNPHRPRPSDLSGLRRNLRQREDGRFVWHWDPRFMSGRLGSRDETRGLTLQHDRLASAARAVAVPTLLVRGKVSDLLSEEGARELLALIPHAEYVDVEGAGHMVAGDKNDLFNDAIAGFLDRLP